MTRYFLTILMFAATGWVVGYTIAWIRNERAK
jgi:hypothetical protein